MTDSALQSVFERYDAISLEELQGKGTTKWAAQPGSVGAWIAEMDFPLAEPVVRSVVRLLEEGTVAYSPASDYEQLARAYTQFYERSYGWAPPAEMVRAIPDVLAGLQAVIERYTRPGSPVIIPTPAYMPFLTLPTYFDREVLQVPLVQEDSGEGERWVYDLDALGAAFDAGAELLVLCNPHNPVGRVLERDEMLAIADLVEAKRGLVFSDEIHAPLVYPGATHVPYASLDERTAAHTITSTSASKAFNLPGLKCAQISFTNPDHAVTWERAGRWIGASRPGIFANIAAYDEGGEWLDGVRAYLDRNRRALVDLVAEYLPGVGYRMPEGTYLALLDFRDVVETMNERSGRAGGEGDPAALLAREAGVVLTPGPACGEAAGGFARLNFGTPLPVLQEAMRRMSSLVM